MLKKYIFLLNLCIKRLDFSTPKRQKAQSFAPYWTPTGASALDPTRGRKAGPWTPPNKLVRAPPKNIIWVRRCYYEVRTSYFIVLSRSMRPSIHDEIETDHNHGIRGLTV